MSSCFSSSFPRDLCTTCSASRTTQQRRALFVNDRSRSKTPSLNIPSMLSVGFIVLFASFVFTTANAFVPSTTTTTRTSQTTRIATPSKTESMRARASSSSITQLGIAKSGGKMIETDKQFADNVLSKDLSRPVLVFFTAPWCGPCRLTVPVVKDVMKQYSGELDVVEVCTDDLAEVAEDAGVLSIPTIQFYFDGAPLETHSIVGCVAKSVLSNAVEKVIEDVAQIRQKR